ncbi:hypothetical protein HJC23_013922 [Cyclotella cryptica]|uniref:Uncharacterized protein n=1 Tax=Cyclotella cryptica TaxID=29204 RepID=A0ABD3QGJ9_9STRA
MADTEDPAFIPPVTSFFHDEDAHSTGSSVTTPDVLTKYELLSNSSKTYNPSLSPGCSIITEMPPERELTLGANHNVLSTVTENFSVQSVSTVPEASWSVVTDKISDHSLSLGSPESKTKPQLKAKECAEVGTVSGNTAARSSTRSLVTSLPNKVSNIFSGSPGSTVASIETEKVSIGPKTKTNKSPGKTVVSVGSVAGTTMSAITEKRFVAGAILSAMTEKDRDGSTMEKDGRTSMSSSKASASSPLDKKRPVTVKEFAATCNANSSVTSPPSTLSIPELPETSEKQPPVRAETPPTPKISNSKSSIKQNLSFSHPHEGVKHGIPSSRSMTPSLERSPIENQVLPNHKKKIAGSFQRQAVSISGENIKSSENYSSLDTIESAIVVTDTLSSTRASIREGSKVTKREIPPLHTKKKTTGAVISQSQSFSYPQKKDKEQIATSSSFDAIRKTKTGKNASHKSPHQTSNETGEDVPKATLFKKALSFGSNSTKRTSNPSFTNDDGIRVFPGFSNNSVCSKGSSKSSKNPASDTSTAASTLSKSSSEIMSEVNFSVASTECTRKISNLGMTSTIKQSLSFTSPRKEKPPIYASRSMSPSLCHRLEDVSSIRTGLKHDLRETIDSSEAKDVSLPPRAPSSQASNQRREIISVVLEAERASKDDDSSIEVVSVPEVPAEKKTHDHSKDSPKPNEGVAATTEDEKSSIPDSNSKRRQKILLGKLLRSRQERRKKATSSISLSDVIDEKYDDNIPRLESVGSDNSLNSNKGKTSRNNYTKTIRKSGGSSYNKPSLELPANLHGSDVTERAISPRFAAKNNDKNEEDANENIHELIPITQIDFNPNYVGDDTSLTIDPELSHKHKFQIWHENTGYVEATSEERFSCGGGGFKLHRDESCIDLTNVGDDFVADDLSYDGRSERQSSPLAFCDDALGEEIVVEMKSAVSKVYSSMKNATWSTARKLLGTFDITANGGVDYLADEVNATQQQLITKTATHNKSARSLSVVESGVPTAQQALDEAVRQKLAQKKENHLQKRCPGSSEQSLKREVTIVEKQEQARIDKEKEDLYKKKKNVQKLKSLALKHM